MKFSYVLGDSLLDEYLKYSDKVTVEYKELLIPAILTKRPKFNFDNGKLEYFYDLSLLGIQRYISSSYWSQLYSDSHDKQFNEDFQIGSDKIKFVFNYPLRLIILFNKIKKSILDAKTNFNKKRPKKYNKFLIKATGL